MRTLFLIFFFFTNFGVFSQKITVFDQKTGKVIKNVTIFNKTRTNKIATNNKGIADTSSFKEDEILIFSHVSYARFRIKKSNLKTQHFLVYLSRESEELDEFVLSVFKKKEKTNRIAEQIAVVSLRDIQKVSPQTSADLLASIPGIKVQKSQSGGGSPILRGMESNRILLVVDGVRMNNAIYRKGHLQNSITVSPNLLDRTEVIFGPSSVIYGSDALGGVIHYYTKTPKISKTTTINSSFFSRFSTVNHEVTNNVSAEVSFKNWASFTSISYSDFGDVKMGKNRSHGFSNWGKVFYFSENTTNFYTATPTENIDVNTQKNTAYTQTDVLQKLFIPLSKNTDLKFNLQYSTSSNIPRFDKLNELKSGSLKFSEWYYGPQQRILISSQLDINLNKKWLEKGTFTAAYQNIKESRITRKFNSLDRNYRKETVDVFSLNGDFSVPLTPDNARQLSYGFEFTHNKVGSNAFGKTLQISGNQIINFTNTFAIQSRYPDGGSSYTSSAAYIDYRQDVSSKSTLNTGIRFTNTYLTATWLNSFITLIDNNINLKNNAVTATIGYVYKPAKNWQLNTVLSSGFRSPNIDDIGKVREKNGNITVPNIHLKPEYAYNAEIGIQKYTNNKKFRFGTNIYYTLLKNYIYREAFQLNGNSTMFYDGAQGNLVANQNKGSAYITGFTASYQGKIAKNWSTSGFVTYTKGKTYDTDEPMSSIPPLFGNFELQYTHQKFEAGANIRFNARKKITDYNITEGIDNHEETPIINTNATQDINKYFGSPSWVTIGLNGKYLMNGNWSAQAQINNLFDVHYKEFASGISAPGRNISISLMANF